MLVHLNGQLVEDAAAVVSVFDRGFLFGDAIFESMRAYRGRIFRMGRHLERLARSADRVGLTEIPSRTDLARSLEELLVVNHLRDARLRLTMTRGPGRPGEYAGPADRPTCVISCAPFAGLAPQLHAEGVTVAIAARRAIPADALDPAIKTTSRMSSVLARREAHERGAFEAVLLDASGDVTEGTASNVFLVHRGRLLTPPISGSALPGVTREAVLESAAEAGLAVAEERVPGSLMAVATEIFLTNTSWEVLPVVRVDGRPIGDRRPGPIARDLLARYRALVGLECGGA